MNTLCGAARPSASLSQQTVTNRNEALASGLEFGNGPVERRHRLTHWRLLGYAPYDLAPATVAAAYVRSTGKQPARDPERRAYRVYSRDELAQALAELRRDPSPPPPADPLVLIWASAITHVALPSTRMLLLQQCELLELRRDSSPLACRAGLIAVVAVRHGWFDTVQARLDLIGNALNEVLAACVAVELVEVGR